MHTQKNKITMGTMKLEKWCENGGTFSGYTKGRPSREMALFCNYILFRAFQHKVVSRK